MTCFTSVSKRSQPPEQSKQKKHLKSPVPKAARTERVWCWERCWHPFFSFESQTNGVQLPGKKVTIGGQEEGINLPFIL